MVSVWHVDRQPLTHFLLSPCVRVSVKSVDRQRVGLWQRVSAQCQGDVFSVTLCWPDLRSDCPLWPHCGSLHKPRCHSHTGLKGSTSMCVCSYSVTCTRSIGIYAHSHFSSESTVRSGAVCTTRVFLTVIISCLFSPFSFSNLFYSIKLELHKLTIYLEIFKQSVKLQALCGNIVWGQWVFWVPQCAARHLHN